MTDPGPNTPSEPVEGFGTPFRSQSGDAGLDATVVHAGEPDAIAAANADIAAEDVVIAALNLRGDRGATVGELASATNIPHTDTSALLALLTEHGYVAPITVWVLTEEGQQRAD